MRKFKKGKIYLDDYTMINESNLYKFLTESKNADSVISKKEKVNNDFIDTTFSLMSKYIKDKNEDTYEYIKQYRDQIKAIWKYTTLETVKHLASTTILATQVEDSNKEFILAMSVHDIGKSYMPTQFLENNRRLDNFRDIINLHHDGEHIDEAYEVISKLENIDFNFPDMVKEIQENHHTKELSNEIVELSKGVDIYEALRSKRCYKSAKPHDLTLKIMAEETVKPEIIDIFKENGEKYIENSMNVLKPLEKSIQLNDDFQIFEGLIEEFDYDNLKEIVHKGKENISEILVRENIRDGNYIKDNIYSEIKNKEISNSISKEEYNVEKNIEENLDFG